MLLAFGFQGNYQGCHGKLLTTVIGSKDFNNASLALFSPQIYLGVNLSHPEFIRWIIV